MRAYIGRHEVLTHEDFVELSLGTDPDLWLGVDGETAAERSARQAAALDILTDEPDLAPAVAVVMAAAIERTPNYLGRSGVLAGGVR